MIEGEGVFEVVVGSNAFVDVDLQSFSGLAFLLLSLSRCGRSKERENNFAAKYFILFHHPTPRARIHIVFFSLPLVYNRHHLWCLLLAPDMRPFPSLLRQDDYGRRSRRPFRRRRRSPTLHWPRIGRIEGSVILKSAVDGRRR